VYKIAKKTKTILISNVAAEFSRHGMLPPACNDTGTPYSILFPRMKKRQSIHCCTITSVCI